MADEGTEAEGAGSSSNGVSGAGAHADARAAFLAMGHDEPAEKPAKVSKPAAREVAEDDSDLDDEDEKPDDEEGERTADADEDPDADLDEDDDKQAAKDDDEKPDADTSKRLSQIQRTEKRMREQLKKERAQMESELEAKARDYESRVHAEIEKWKPRIDKAERFEQLSARVDVDPVAVLQSLGLKKERYEHAAQVLYTLSKADTGDENARRAAAQLIRDRERDDEIDNLKKWREDREKTDAQRAKEAEQQAKDAEADRNVDAFITSVTKAASEKTPLAKAYLKNDPAGAREELQIVAYKLTEETGTLPSAKAVMIAFEKRQRAALRARGIDPKSRGAAAALTDESKTTTTTKKSDKTTEKPSEKSNGQKLSPRDAFIRGDKFD